MFNVLNSSQEKYLQLISCPIGFFKDITLKFVNIFSTSSNNSETAEPKINSKVILKKKDSWQLFVSSLVGKEVKEIILVNYLGLLS